MPSESVLKVLIALNAVQMFITMLLLATMASASLSSGSTTTVATSDYGQLGSAPDPFAAAGALDPLAGDDNRPPGEEPPGEGPGGEPGEGQGGAPGEEPPNDGAPSNADIVVQDPNNAPSAGATAAADDGRTKIIMRTYLNLVSRRLQVAASDAGTDPEAWLPTSDEISAAVDSGDASSAEFNAALEKLRPGYAQLGMDFPSPPAPKTSPEAN